MRDDELNIELAEIRKYLRHVEVEMDAIRNESRRFQRMGFGRDIKDGELRALEEDRDLCLERMAWIERELGRCPSPRYRTPRHKVMDLVVILFAFVLVGVESIQSKKRRSVGSSVNTRRSRVGMRVVPAVDMSLPD